MISLLKELLRFYKRVTSEPGRRVLDNIKFIKLLDQLEINNTLLNCTGNQLKDTVLILFELLYDNTRNLKLSHKRKQAINQVANCIAKLHRVSNDSTKDLENTLLATICLLRVDNLRHA